MNDSYKITEIGTDLDLIIEAEKVGRPVNLLLQLEQSLVLSRQLLSQLEKEVKSFPETQTLLSQTTLRIMEVLCNQVLEKTQETGGPQLYRVEKKNIQEWSSLDQDNTQTTYTITS